MWSESSFNPNAECNLPDLFSDMFYKSVHIFVQVGLLLNPFNPLFFSWFGSYLRFQIVATALCHSDLYHLLESMHEDGFPVILGHEAAGFVESVGPGVTEFQPGQSLTIFVNINKCLFAYFTRVR